MLLLLPPAEGVQLSPIFPLLGTFFLGEGAAGGGSGIFPHVFCSAVWLSWDRVLCLGHVVRSQSQSLKQVHNWLPFHSCRSGSEWSETCLRTIQIEVQTYFRDHSILFLWDCGKPFKPVLLWSFSKHCEKLFETSIEAVQECAEIILNFWFKSFSSTVLKEILRSFRRDTKKSFNHHQSSEIFSKESLFLFAVELFTDLCMRAHYAINVDLEEAGIDVTAVSRRACLLPLLLVLLVHT